MGLQGEISASETARGTPKSLTKSETALTSGLGNLVITDTWREVLMRASTNTIAVIYPTLRTNGHRYLPDLA